MDDSVIIFVRYDEVNFNFSLIVLILLGSTLVDFNNSTSFLADTSEYWADVLAIGILLSTSVDSIALFIFSLLRKFFMPTANQPELFLESYNNSYIANYKRHKPVSVKKTNNKSIYIQFHCFDSTHISDKETKL